MTDDVQTDWVGGPLGDIGFCLIIRRLFLSSLQCIQHDTLIDLFGSVKLEGC